jgi:hypothetical protein
MAPQVPSSSGRKAGIVCGPSDGDPDAFGARFRSSSARGRPNVLSHAEQPLNARLELMWCKRNMKTV